MTLYGSGVPGPIHEAWEERDEAVDLLVEVATNKKSIEDFQKWLEEHYPDSCFTIKKQEGKAKRWQLILSSRPNRESSVYRRAFFVIVVLDFIGN